VAAGARCALEGRIRELEMGIIQMGKISFEGGIYRGQLLT